MSELTRTAEFRDAIHEVHRYLGDELAPMMVTDSVLFLIEQPASLLAPQIHAWVNEQCSRGDSKNSASDYIYHTLKKLHLLCEFHLVDGERLRRYLQDLAGDLLTVCPEEERDRLQKQLAHLGDSEALLTSAPVEQIYRAGGQRQDAASPGSKAGDRHGAATDDAMNRGLHRLSLLLERLGHSETVGLQRPASPEREQVRAQALVTAAVQARNETELQEYLRRLGGAGIDARPEQLFRMLSRSLPAWNIPLVTLGPMAAGETCSNRPMEAMRKMVTLAETPQEWARRFNDLVHAAIEQFNEGSLVRAAAMLDLAERMLAGKAHHLDVVVAIRRRAHEAIKEGQLRKYAERPEDRSMLLRFMNFFTAMTVEGLLRQLHEETKRERRWLLLLLLEAHGTSARAAALQELEAFLRGDKTDPDGYHQRNLIYIMRRIPAGEAGPGVGELEVLARLSKLDQPAIVVREAIRTLGPLSHPVAERTLINRLREFEGAVLRQAPAPPGGEPNPILELLDQLCSALAAQRTAGSMNEIIRHALREEPALGKAVARLDVLGTQDLSAWPETVGRLLETLRDLLPRKIFGLVMKEREPLPHLIRALAGTPLPVVRATLEEVASKYSTQQLGIEAAKALEGLKAVAQRTETAAPGLAGDIELFGLPNLFQTFSDSRVTGALTLRDERGGVCGTVRFKEGKIRTCEYLHLKGEDALCQLFEKFEARKFQFKAEPLPPAGGPTENLTEVVPLLMEAMRRHDELQQARALVPDGARLRATSTKPERLSEEEDLTLAQAVWSKAVTGSTPEQCEAEVPADSYRIRRLLAHWVEGGALQMGLAATNPA